MFPSRSKIFLGFSQDSGWKLGSLESQLKLSDKLIHRPGLTFITMTSWFENLSREKLPVLYPCTIVHTIYTFGSAGPKARVVDINHRREGIYIHIFRRR